MVSSSSSETAFKIEKLNNDNYVTWSANIEQVLKLKNCWEAVCAPPAEVERVLNDKDALRSRSELTAVLQVAGETEGNMQMKAAALTELAALDWARKDEVALATLHLNVAAIHHETFRKRSDEGMIEYINRGTMLRYELGQLGQEPSEADLVTALLTGLPSTYATTVELLESGGIPSLRTATERLMAAEVKRLGTADKGHDNRPVAYAAGAGEGRFEQGMGERLCFHCERPGHIRRYCPERRRKDGGGSGLAMAVVGSRMEPKWAGTSQEASGSKWVQMPNGSTAATNVSGMVNLPVWTANGSTTLTLRKVLYVEGMEVNLFSVQAIMQHGYGATFTNGNVSINRGSSRVLDGVRAGTMHVLPTAGSWGKNRADNDCYLAAAAVGADVWHRRLGHCGLTDLKDVARATSGMRVTGKGIKNALRKGCKPCRLAKPEEDLYGLEGDSESSHEYSDEDDTDNTGPPGGGLGDAGDGAGSSGGGADGTNPPSEGGDVGGGGGPPQDTGDAGGSPPSAADTLHGGKRGGAAGPRGRDSGGSQDALVGEPPRGGAAPLSSIAEAVAAAEVLFGLTPGKAGDADADGEGGRATTADVGGAPEAGGGLAEAAEAAAALMRELEL
ncbi:hypothetical protein I4F81_006264 [Pyropia yezoensis]|uniref:Uncharacterized protein n=1 Tax=Pyropia yezoensis TaxID=2788 RepID=A0ACC3C0Q5_PYRYE|nr:hypothetical protein I4F81_006264 [Neopyropia yezoensis]